MTQIRTLALATTLVLASPSLFAQATTTLTNNAKTGFWVFMGGSDCKDGNKGSDSGIHMGDETDRICRWTPAGLLEVSSRFLTAFLAHLFSGLVADWRV